MNSRIRPSLYIDNVATRSLRGKITIAMNNTVALICSKMHNLTQMVQLKFEENVNWVMCHVFFFLQQSTTAPTKGLEDEAFIFKL